MITAGKAVSSQIPRDTTALVLAKYVLCLRGVRPLRASLALDKAHNIGM
jgi:hypothetical protein